MSKVFSEEFVRDDGDAVVVQWCWAGLRRVKILNCAGEFGLVELNAFEREGFREQVVPGRVVHEDIQEFGAHGVGNW